MDKSKIFNRAWSLVNNTSISNSEALKMAWKEAIEATLFNVSGLHEFTIGSVPKKNIKLVDTDPNVVKKKEIRKAYNLAFGK